MNPAGFLRGALSSLYLGAPQRVGELCFVPLFVERGDLEAEFLEEALARGATTVAEVSEHGRVGTVKVTHGGQRLLLLVDGEQVVGAKQNRVFNASFLVPPGGEVEIPVSCVERGRWGYHAPVFKASGTTLTGNARAAKLRRVSDSVRARGTYDADQSAVWKDVDTYLDQTLCSSPTSAFSDAYASRAAEVERRSAMLAPAEGQVGVAAVRAGKIVGLDLFGSASLFARGWSKIVRGLLAEVYGAAVETAGDPSAVVRQCIAALTDTPIERRAAPGCGTTIHGHGRGYVVGGVALDDSLYHLLVVAA
jgi:hypothetical protein